MADITKEDVIEFIANMSVLDLSELVKTETDDTMVFSEADLDLPQDEAEAVAVEEETSTVEAIGITTLGTWFEDNAANFDNINKVNVSIRGIDPTSNLIIAVKDGTEEHDESGEDKRQLRVFDNADTQPVLALKGIDMQIYNNGFRAICEYVDNIYIKKEYNKLRRLIVRVLREIEEFRTLESDRNSALSLDQLKLEVEEKTERINGGLDDLIRKDQIDVLMATSLMNDISYCREICWDLLQAGSTLFSEYELDEKSAMSSIALDEHEISEIMDSEEKELAG